MFDELYTAVGRAGYVIRIINQLRTNRGLLKGFTGAITDVTFAHAGSNNLAAIDQGGNLYIWKLEEKEMEVKYPPPLYNEYFIVFDCLSLNIYQSTASITCCP